MAEPVTIGAAGTLFVGEDKILNLELLDADGLPVDMAGWLIHIVISARDTSSAPILTAVASIVGVFNAVRASNTQRARVTLTDDDLNLFSEKTYRHSWKRMDANVETILAWGDFTPDKATAP